MEEKYLIGIDVGSGSVRAAVVDVRGNVIKVDNHPIKMWNPKNDFYEQSTEDIWKACCVACKSVVESLPSSSSVVGVGFDATCSLVALDKQHNPLSVSPTKNNEQNVIMWMDHRAKAEAELICSIGHEALKFVGGQISLEMQPPKLLWLKENMGLDWWKNSVGFFMDLPDYLTWRSTGSMTRSLCSAVCKWLYQPQKKSEQWTHEGWDSSFWTDIGLEDLLEDNCRKIGQVIIPPGTLLGGLTPNAAADLGLFAGTAVGASLIDAHAGGLALFACDPGLDLCCRNDVTQKVALIAGTSTCHMTVSQNAIFVPGVWGPYYSVIIPGFWTNEGGQSAAGKLLDHILEMNREIVQLLPKDKNVYEALNEYLLELKSEEKVSHVAQLTRNFHVWPDYHGNRSPLADSSLKGMVCGFSLDAGLKGLAINYLAAVQALAYGTYHILQSMTESGHSLQCIFVCGGLAKNDLYVTTHADVTGLPVIRPREPESVLLGAAMLGGHASGEFESLKTAMTAMGGDGEVVLPAKETEKYHERKYEVFLQMLKDQQEYKRIMALC